MDSPAIGALILRFRDLVTEAGGTIKRHREILQRTGFVWWGWWNRAGEQVPPATFQSLNAKAKAQKGIAFLLYDSGRDLIWRATCQEIRWGFDGGLIDSPDPSATPVYYRGQEYLAWFRFSDISEDAVSAEELTRWTYERADSFFASGVSRFDAFYGKRVFSGEELRQQDRTIWFVRPTEEGDPTHEIQLLDSKRVSPSHFPRETMESDSVTFLWLSDVHFSAEEHHGFPLQRGTARVDLASALERDLETLEKRKLAGVLISGDLTWKAKPEEFALVNGFIGNVQRWSTLSNYQFLICPGNHDLKFSEDPAVPETPATTVAAEARAAYEAFYKELYYLRPNEHLSCGRRFLLARTYPVEIVSLNSSLLEQHAGLFQGHGFLGEEQLQTAARELEWKETEVGANPFRIVMLHHHVVPVSYREQPALGVTYSVVLDAGALIRWAARYRVDAIIHGHMHQPFTAQLTVPVRNEGALTEWHTLHIVGMGSTGVSRQDIPDIAKNTFGLIAFGNEGVTVTVYTIDASRPRERKDSPHFTVTVPYRRP